MVAAIVARLNRTYMRLGGPEQSQISRDTGIFSSRQPLSSTGALNIQHRGEEAELYRARSLVTLSKPQDAHAWRGAGRR